MKGEIIAIGDELTSGRILNTTSGFAARNLFEAGYDIYAMHTIGDTPDLIGEALQRAINRVDFVIVTGGLGVTDDDLTNEAVSKALNRPTLPNLEILSLIRTKLDALSSTVSSQLEKLAWLPKGAEAFNPQAEMSGYLLEHDSKPIFFLPGVPSQMKLLLIEHVLPRLAVGHAGRQLTTHQRLFKIFNLTEIEVNQKISDLSFNDNVHIGYYPVFPELHLSLTVREQDGNDLNKVFKTSCDAIDSAFSPFIYGYDHDSMELIVGKLLSEAGLSLATAESCTGGLISHKLTSIPGSSEYFLGGVTSYSNDLKVSMLSVSELLLESVGAVSKEVAKAMAEGIREKTGADITISVTGIAGPTGGTETKPVGTVFIAICTPAGTEVHHFNFSGERIQIQEITAQTGLDLVRSYLLQNT